MAGTRKARVPMAEQIRLINECRQSGMIDAGWCRENDIAVSSFYNWVNRCRKATANQTSVADYSHLEIPRPRQDVILLTLCRITFRNSIQNCRYKTRTLTIHIRLKLLWRISQSAFSLNDLYRFL